MLQDVLVWPHAGKSLYGADDLPFVHEMLRLRGMYSPGRVHTVSVDKSGKNVLQMNKAATILCPAPRWTDFR
jgi:hypothetical protein